MARLMATISDGNSDQLPTEIAPADRLLTAAEFHRLADVPPEVEWFAKSVTHTPAAPTKTR